MHIGDNVSALNQEFKYPHRDGVSIGQTASRLKEIRAELKDASKPADTSILPRHFACNTLIDICAQLLNQKVAKLLDEEGRYNVFAVLRPEYDGRDEKGTLKLLALQVLELLVDKYPATKEYIAGKLDIELLKEWAESGIDPKKQWTCEETNEKVKPLAAKLLTALEAPTVDSAPRAGK
jgi:hypothetical protein